MARVLVVGPHPDDQEAGMGGSVALLASQGHDVLLLDLTDGEPTPLGSHEIRKKEAAAALEVFNAIDTPGAKPVKRLLLGLPNRTVQHTIEARHAVAGVIRAHQADVIFTPFFQDAHPDHLAGTRIVEDARFDAKLTKIDMPAPVDGWTGEKLEVGPPIYPKWLFYYYATHLRWVADPTFLLDITEFQQTKLDAIRAYETQFVIPERNRQAVEWIESAGRYYGSRIGSRAAEPFYTKEPVGLTGLSGLVM
ncbi:MAG: PIG-L family deacetylase [Planctomycetota bacterium]